MTNFNLLFGKVIFFHKERLIKEQEELESQKKKAHQVIQEVNGFDVSLTECQESELELHTLPD